MILIIWCLCLGALTVTTSPSTAAVQTVNTALARSLGMWRPSHPALHRTLWCRTLATCIIGALRHPTQTLTVPVVQCSVLQARTITTASGPTTVLLTVSTTRLLVSCSCEFRADLCHLLLPLLLFTTRTLGLARGRSSSLFRQLNKATGMTVKYHLE